MSRQQNKFAYPLRTRAAGESAFFLANGDEERSERSSFSRLGLEMERAERPEDMRARGATVACAGGSSSTRKLSDEPEADLAGATVLLVSDTACRGKEGLGIPISGEESSARSAGCP
jgi:hypothetical protein